MPLDEAEATPRSFSALIYRTLSYADVFGFPLSVDEIQRFLVGRTANLDEVERALRDDPWLAERVVQQNGLVALAGREENFGRRAQRLVYSQGLQATARHYGRLLGMLPFVRAVLLTGSLAVDSAQDPGDDVDYLLVTEPGRLWLARLCAVSLVRLARLRGADICPNYLLARDRLELEDRSLYTAHELAQMVPLYGVEVQAELLAANAWAKRLLPNAFELTKRHEDGLPGPLRWAKAASEWLLGGRLGDALEARERRAKVAKLSLEAARRGAGEAVFDAGCCKGHMGGYGGRTVSSYRARLRAMGLDGESGE